MGKTRKDNPYKYGNEHGRKLKKIKRKQKRKQTKDLEDIYQRIKQDVSYSNDWMY